MSTLRLTSDNLPRKPRSRMGGFWDKFSSRTGEPPYKRLPDYHIRVVKIKPGTDKYPLHVKLKVVDPRKAKYTALSYTWETDDEGSSEDDGANAPETHTILCGSRPFRVKQNLYDALCQIRDVQSDVPIFVDALCINFNDHRERMDMINIMGHVYSCAASVIVWLGKKNRSSDETITVMKRMVNAIDWRKIGDANSYNFRDPQFFTTVGMEAPTIAQWGNIHYFCHLRWFTRYWAFFELVLGKRAIFLYGDTCMDYEFLVDFGMIMGLSGFLDEIGEMTGGFRAGSAASFIKMLGPVARLRTIPPWHPQHADNAAWMRDNYGLQTEVERAWKFFEILIESALPFECQNPRDKYFAALAVIRTIYAGQPINKQWPEPDYSQPVEVVSRCFNDLILRHTHSPSVLAPAQASTSIPRRPVGSQDAEDRGRRRPPRMPLQ